MSTDTDNQLSLQQLLNQNQQLQTTNQQLLSMIEQLRAQLDKLQNMLFGQRSEKQKKKAAANEEQSQSTHSATNNANKDNEKSKANGRNKLPADLPRHVLKHDIPEAKRQCQYCQGQLHCVGKDVSEQLDVIPMKLFVIEHRRYKYACRCCRRMTLAPMPEQPIDKGLAASGLLADTLISKYQEHQPLYRQSL